jgi:CheY-like chemotaxis protein
VPVNRLILIVDDSADDLLLLRRSLKKAGVLNPVREVRSACDARAYLSAEGQFENREAHPFPGILLLDLHMPGGDGFEVLQWIRDKLPVRGLLVIVLSRLDEVKNINRAYALGPNSFLTKPGDARELETLIKTFHDYWILRNKSPEVEQHGDHQF